MKGFSEERRYLSNMYKVPITFQGDIFNSSEAIYMLFKNDSPEWRKFILENKPERIKAESRKIEIVEDWDKRRIPAMRLALTLKFSQHPELLKKLKSEEELIEWNNRGDRFWGVDNVTGIGSNNLGELLSDIRNSIPLPKLSSDLYEFMES